MLRLLLIIIIFLLLLGTLPTWPYATGWGLGYYPTGGLGLILIILVILLLVDRRGLP
jgi:sterol desaturase/sphingolipid hydroxylase (fatty acid hydroxylase superfamily)